ncbi:MAG: cyclic nucleotide-binding domain-containing protein [Candidatus Limnocylindria bacterium]
MAKDEKLELLHRIPLFSGLDKRQLLRLGQLTDEVDVADGRVLMREGQPGDELFIVIQGTLRVEREGQVVARRGPGEFVGEIALVDEGPRVATVVSDGPARLLVVGHRAFHTLMEEFPPIQLVVLRELARRVRHLDREEPH